LLNYLKQKILQNPLSGRAYLSLRYGPSCHCIHPYLNIPGWLSIPEAVELYRVAAFQLPPENPIIVEIGSWLGKSSVVLGKALAKQGKGKIYCIDPFDTSGDPDSQTYYQNQQKNLGQTPWDIFQKNIKINHVAEKIEVLRGFSYDYSANWKDPIGFLFIDGNHDYKAVLQDFNEWSPSVVKGGIVAFHDVYFDEKCVPTGRFPGPARVIHQKILNNPTWKNHRQIETLFLAVKSS